MTKYAQIIDGYAINVSADPFSEFHRDFAKHFVEVPDSVEIGFFKDKKKGWIKPDRSSEATPQYFISLPPYEFKKLFTFEELGSITDLKDSDSAVSAFWDFLNDPKTEAINLGSKSVQSVIKKLVALLSDSEEFDADAREAAILAATPQ